MIHTIAVAQIQLRMGVHLCALNSEFSFKKVFLAQRMVMNVISIRDTLELPLPVSVSTQCNREAAMRGGSARSALAAPYRSCAWRVDSR